MGNKGQERGNTVFLGDMIVNKENPKDFTKQVLDLVLLARLQYT